LVKISIAAASRQRFGTHDLTWFGHPLGMCPTLVNRFYLDGNLYGPQPIIKKTER
jgi:hypothetical protein